MRTLCRKLLIGFVLDLIAKTTRLVIMNNANMTNHQDATVKHEATDEEQAIDNEKESKANRNQTRNQTETESESNSEATEDNKQLLTIEESNRNRIEKNSTTLYYPLVPSTTIPYSPTLLPPPR